MYISASGATPTRLNPMLCGSCIPMIPTRKVRTLLNISYRPHTCDMSTVTAFGASGERVRLLYRVAVVVHKRIATCNLVSWAETTAEGGVSIVDPGIDDANLD